MTKIYVTTNNKGGVGKTTTSKRLIEYLAEQGFKVGAIDADPQGNLSLLFGYNESNINCSFYDLLTNPEIKFEDCIHKTGNDFIDIVPATIKLQEANFNLQSNVSMIPQLVLKGKLSNSNVEYDYIVIDTAPNLDMVLYNVLAVSTDLIIPIKADLYSLTGLEMLLRIIDDFSSLFNSYPNKVMFLNSFKESKTHKEFYELMSKSFSNNFMSTYIKDRVAINRTLLNAVELENDKTSDSREVVEQFACLFDEVMEND